MSEPYLVYLETTSYDAWPSVVGNARPVRILYVLSEDDVADAYDQVLSPDLDPGDGDHTAYYALSSDQRDTLFHAARKAIEWTDFATGEWNETLVDSVRDTLKEGT